MIEDEFETDDFERVLKEYADQFLMKPSEKVWRSIYNDLHPGSRWPSLAMGIFMLLTLFWLGNSNVRRAQKPVENTDTQKVLTQPGNNSPASIDLRRNAGATSGSTSLTNKDKNPDLIAVNDEISTGPEMTLRAVNTGNLQAVEKSSASGVVSGTTSYYNGIQSGSATAGILLNNTGIASVPGNKISERANANDETKVEEETTARIQTKHIRKRVEWKYFANPMVSSVLFGGVNLNQPNSTVANTPVSVHSMSITDRVGIILGANAYYPLGRRLSLVSGAHMTFTGYNILGQAKRPNTASVTFVDSKGQMFTKKYVSYYANSKNPEARSTDINNYNWQVSVPVGLRYDVLTKNKFRISVISGVEPFMVMGSKAYLLSGDAGSYVTDPGLVRKFNFNTNFATVISFDSKTANWEIGPDFRYQALSTYNKIYPVKEHLINYGLHIAVSKKN